MFKMSIGENIKNLRTEANLTQEMFAIFIDVAPMTIANIEANRYKPSLQVVIKIADVLGITTDEVLGHYVEDPKI